MSVSQVVCQHAVSPPLPLVNKLYPRWSRHLCLLGKRVGIIYKEVVSTLHKRFTAGD